MIGDARRAARFGLASWHALALACVCAAGCAGLAPAFDPRFGDNDDERSARVLARIAQPQSAPDGALRLVATSDAARQELLLADFAGGVRFRVAADAQARPEWLGGLVLVAGRGELQAFATASGAALWSRPLAGCERYLGAARDGEVIAFACEAPASGKASAGAAPSLLRALSARDGSLLWQRLTPDALGRPAASDGLLLVPWQRQGLAVLDARDGVELARLRSRDDVIDWVRAEPGFAWFGHRQAYLIGPRGYGGSRKDAVALSVAAETLPGRPALVESAYSTLPGKRSAHGRVALSVRPVIVDRGEHEPGARAPVQLSAGDGRAYFSFYRYVFGYDASGTLVWTRLLDHDVIAARAVDGGLALATETGELLLLAASDGSERGRRELGVKLAAATWSGQGRVPVGAASSPVSSLREGLLAVALDVDQRLVPARAYAIEQLARLPEPEVTADLLHIYGRSTTPPELQRVVAGALRGRRTGLEHVVDALLQRYDFIKQTRPAPLAVLVPALLDAREQRAVPNLVARMLDHETPLAVLAPVVHAVVELGDERVAAPLLRFLRWYRADSSLAQQPEALLEAARGVLRHGGETGAQQLAALVGDGIVTPALGSEVARLLAPVAVEEPAAVAAAKAAQRPLPPSLGAPELRAAFDAHAPELRGCLAPELAHNPKLAQVRIALIVESDGSTHAVQVAPASAALADCMYGKLANLRFPRFRSGRQVATYVLAARERTPEEPAPEAAPGGVDDVFWALQAAHPRTLAAQSEPWWRSKQPIVALALPPPLIGPGPMGAQLAPARPAAPAGAVPGPAAAPARDRAPGPAPTAGAAPAADQGGAAAEPGPTPGAVPAAPAEAGAASEPSAEDAWWVPAGK